jgi:hypothetical protein
MAKPSELLEEAAKCRDLAKRAARFAASLLCDADRARLLGRAKRLEEQAAELERQSEDVWCALKRRRLVRAKAKTSGAR